MNKITHNPFSNNAEWLDSALSVFHAGSSPHLSHDQPKPDFEKRCKEAVLRGLDVLRMNRCQPQLQDSFGSLIEHFRAVARVAGVKLEGVLASLGIGPTASPNAANAPGLALLAQHIGLEYEDALFRLRLAYALVCRTSARPDLRAALQPQRSRDTASSAHSLESTKTALQRCEAQYDPPQRAELQKMESVFAGAYKQTS